LFFWQQRIHKENPWDSRNDGIMEDWNNGFNGTLSILYKKIPSVFNPSFQHSKIPVDSVWLQTGRGP